MRLPPDSQEFLRLLNSHGVRYLLVGGWAVAWHGHPRFTGDVDLFIDTAPDNAQRIAATVEAFMPGVFGWTPEQFGQVGNWFKMGFQPQQIEILTEITAVSWTEAWESRVDGTLEDIPIHLISRDLLLRNKRATDRDKDREDVKRLVRRVRK